MASLEKILQRTIPNQVKLIVTDGVFSMEGDIAQLNSIVELSEKYGQQTVPGGPIKIDLHLTQRDLASIVGTTRESINKELRILREKGLVITEEDALHILDFEGLTKRARL